jgi:hypothetical protein
MEARQIVDSLGVPGVREPNLPYGTDHTLGPAVDLLANILNSGDQVIIQALMSNLHAYSRAIEKDKQQLGRIQELEEKCKALEKRMNTLESKLALDEKSKAA